MELIRNATEDEMILTFLQAEIKSDRWGKYVRYELNKYGCTDSIICEPSLDDDEENRIRKLLLQYRGYGLNSSLFAGFPNDVKWYSYYLNCDDLGKLYVIAYNQWVKASINSRTAAEVAINIKNDRVDFEEVLLIYKVLEDIQQGMTYPDIICVGIDTCSLVILEGHIRVIAYLLNNDPVIDLKAFIGISSNMNTWDFINFRGMVYNGQ